MLICVGVKKYIYEKMTKDRQVLRLSGWTCLHVSKVVIQYSIYI